jgi:hypothetical protein
MPSSQKRAARPEAPALLCQLRVTLGGIEPGIWRRLEMPGNANLGWLHAVLQVAMGWTNSHLHQFLVGKDLYTDPSFELEELDRGPHILDEHGVTLAEIAPCEKAEFAYEYDFGDSWTHVIVVEKLLEPSGAAATVARCLEGARACPPDDCGGVGGYENLVEVLRDPKHEEHESMKEWLGRPFDPEAFDLGHVNAYLGKLKWPRVTEHQLAKVLMARDGVRA